MSKVWLRYALSALAALAIAGLTATSSVTPLGDSQWGSHAVGAPAVQGGIAV